VEIGAIFNDNTGGFFAGVIDEVEIFNRALTQREVQRIYDAASGGKCPCVTPPSNMVAWWPGDDNAKDIQGGNDGTVNGATFGPGEVNDAFNFDGSDHFISVPDSPALRVTAATGFTFDFWVQPTQFNGGNTGNELILGKAITPGANASYFAFFDANGDIGIGLQNSSEAPEWITTSSLPLNQWTHVALVYRAVNFNATDMTIYVNGAPVSTTFAANGYDSTFSIGYSTNRFVFGGDADNLVGGSMAGALDELELFSRPLTATEVQ